MDDKSKFVYLFGTKQNGPFIEAFLGNGPVTTALREFCKTRKFSWRKDAENQVVLRLEKTEDSIEFIKGVEGEIPLWNLNINSDALVKIMKENQDVDWFFWVR